MNSEILSFSSVDLKHRVRQLAHICAAKGGRLPIFNKVQIWTEQRLEDCCFSVVSEQFWRVMSVSFGSQKGSYLFEARIVGDRTKQLVVGTFHEKSGCGKYQITLLAQDKSHL